MGLFPLGQLVSRDDALHGNRRLGLCMLPRQRGKDVSQEEDGPGVQGARQMRADVADLTQGEISYVQRLRFRKYPALAIE